ncbi:colicin transporter [Actinotalea ferrariae]|uniref:SAV_6107 family HEPN domain-containing protein n=1 Tax=Actinotalea ferrariae TaxID=1386098 RepID=UPI001C8B3C0B|nr:SAV_6107 family HEPN domain-containing protein [Actinotalea ferrariae]MBX9246766.1 colicin transporter [Actinotalea ferrariae]
MTGRSTPAVRLVGDDGEVRPPVPTSALDLLLRSDAELVAAQLEGSVEERFLHGHLAALRAGAALLEVTGRPRRRPMPRTVWDMVAAVAPELEHWTSFFAAGAPARAAVEAGRGGAVDPERAEATVAAAEDFQDAVRRTLALDTPERGRLLLHAS